MFAKPMFSMLVWSYYVTGQLNFASNGHEAAMIAPMASCAALRNSATALLQPVYATPLSCNQIKKRRTIALRSSGAPGVLTGRGG
jgi:hypothetical protein